MSLGKRFILFLSIIATSAALVHANPIPWPLPANMPLEDMYSYLQENDAGNLQESFIGNYYFSYIPTDVVQMKYPMPPKSNGIGVSMGRLPEDWEFLPGSFPYLHEMQMQIYMDEMKWYFIRSLYPTVLPEWPGIPMIAWNGPFPEQALLSVKYQHNLLKRGRNYIYFYALGTGKYYQTYQKEALAFLDISMPRQYNMYRLFLDQTPLPFAVTSERDDSGTFHRIVSIYATAEYGPFTEDIIGHIRRIRPVRARSTAHLEEDKEDDANVTPQIKLRYKVNECGTSEPPGIEPNVFPSGRRMIVSDQIYFNCCPEYVRMTILVNGNQVIFQEKAIEEAPCDCICYYPMKGIAGPFSPGTYNVQIKDPHGKKIFEREIVIII